MLQSGLNPTAPRASAMPTTAFSPNTLIFISQSVLAADSAAELYVQIVHSVLAEKAQTAGPRLG